MSQIKLTYLIEMMSIVRHQANNHANNLQATTKPVELTYFIGKLKKETRVVP